MPCGSWLLFVSRSYAHCGFGLMCVSWSTHAGNKAKDEEVLVKTEKEGHVYVCVTSSNVIRHLLDVPVL